MAQSKAKPEATLDVVVVGGGLAGTIAAARATDLGLRVAMLEAGSGAQYPCNVRYSGGVLHVAFNDIKAPPDMLRAAIDRATDGHADSAQAETIASNAGRFVDWLRDQGIGFTRTAVDWQTHIFAPSRAIKAGQDWRDRGPDVMLRHLADRIRARRGQIRTGVRGVALVMAEGRCAGIETLAGQRRESIAARAVVLADGGFQANLDLIGNHITPNPTRVKQRGGASGVGDGLQMARAIGAQITRLDRFYGHLLCRDAMNNDNVWPYPELDALALAGVLVTEAGERFADEGRGGVALANAVARLADPLSATAVFDARIWEGPGRSARIPANPSLEAAGGTILRAPTLAELAWKAGIDGDRLAATIAAHNTAISDPGRARLSPPRTTAKHPPLPIIAPPFMAIPVCAGITYTMGGVKVDGRSRVLRPDGTAIAGLFAAGSTTGGLEGGEHAAYVGGLAKAGVQGLIAAETIAETLRPHRG